MVEREMSSIELSALKKGQIPSFDTIYGFTNGLAKTALKGKFGVIDTNFQVVLENRFDEIHIQENGFIIARTNREYRLFTNTGYPLCERRFIFLHDAKKYVNFFCN